MTQADSDTHEPRRSPIGAGQSPATVDPDQPKGDLIGNFGDFECLFAQLGEPLVIELGKPLPGARYMRRPRAGCCPAAHNRALLREEN